MTELSWIFAIQTLHRWKTLCPQHQHLTAKYTFPFLGLSILCKTFFTFALSRAILFLYLFDSVSLFLYRNTLKKQQSQILQGFLCIVNVKSKSDITKMSQRLSTYSKSLIVNIRRPTTVLHFHKQHPGTFVAKIGVEWLSMFIHQYNIYLSAINNQSNRRLV